MLSDDERAAIVETIERPDASWDDRPELVRAARAMVAQGRGRIVDLGYEVRSDGIHCTRQFEVSDFGHKALRIDALIRQWGYQP